MRLNSWPLLDALDDVTSILLAGAGGGFDIYSGLPLYFALKARGKKVSLANLSFAPLPPMEEIWLTPSCARITADTPYSQTYFPEYQLSCWFRDRHGDEVPIYCFPHETGVAPLRDAYRKLHAVLELDAVVLVDGGTDSLMRGDEVGLGTPSEDVTSIAAAAASEIPRQFLACIGFGIDTFHGVCHAQFLEAVAALSRAGGFLGVASVLAEMPEAVEFLSAVEYANQRISQQSIVANSIASSIEGHFGDYHRTERTRSSRLWINPLMPIYWAFELRPVVERNLYIELLGDTQSLSEVLYRISAFREECEARSWDEMPV